MELVLNAFWLLTALLGFGLWSVFFRRRGAVGNRSRFLPELISLSCALLLLFPAISLTDDLHSELVLFSEWNFSRRTLRGGVQHSVTLPADAQEALAPAAVVPALLPLQSIFSGLVVPVDAPRFTVELARSCEGRAPPVSLS